MKKTYYVMVGEIQATLRRKTFVFFAFVLPLLLGLVALIYAMLNAGSASTTAAIPVEALTPSDKLLVQGYVDAGRLVVDIPAHLPADSLVAFTDTVTADEALQAGDIAGYFVIPEDYLQTGQMSYAQRQYSPLGESPDSEMMAYVVAYNLLEGDRHLAGAIRSPFTTAVTELHMDDVEQEGGWFSELFPTMMVLLLYLSILIPAGGLTTAFADEKKHRVMEMLMSSVSARQLLVGKFFALALLGLVQFALWIALFWAIASFGGQPLGIGEGFDFPFSIVLWMMLYFLLGYAIYGAQLAGIGALAPDVKDTKTASMVVMSPLILAYMFMMIVFIRPDSTVAQIMSLFPLTSPITMIARMSVGDVPLWEASLAAAIQLSAAVLVLYLVAKLFRAQHLLSGQPFSVRGYYSALFARAPSGARADLLANWAIAGLSG